MLTTVIGAFPKPSFLKITDWFNASGGTDTANPTKFYEEEINRMGSEADDIFSHVIAGDIVSPNQTTYAIEAMVKWIRRLPHYTRKTQEYP